MAACFNFEFIFLKEISVKKLIFPCIFLKTWQSVAFFREQFCEKPKIFPMKKREISVWTPPADEALVESHQRTRLPVHAHILLLHLAYSWANSYQ
jgi:hypothetical protein